MSVWCHTWSLSEIRQSDNPAAAGFFMPPPGSTAQEKPLHSTSNFREASLSNDKYRFSGRPDPMKSGTTSDIALNAANTAKTSNFTQF
jgi:hypothetical protein